MKIAVQFYGHLRTFRQTADNINDYFIDYLNKPDIFIHSWDNTDHSDISWHNQDGEKRGNELMKSDLEFLQKNFKPKKVVIEPQLSPKDTSNLMMITGNEVDFKNTYNVFYTKWKVNEIRKEYQKANNIKYDLVIFARLDLLFNKKFKIQNFITYKNIKGDKLDINIDNKFFYCPEQFTFNHNQDLINSSGSDVIFFARENVINKVVGIWEKFDNFDFKQHFYSNEYLLLHSALVNNIEPVKIDFFKDKDFNILRPQENYSNLTKPQKNKPFKKLLKKLKI